MCLGGTRCRRLARDGSNGGMHLRHVEVGGLWPGGFMWSMGKTEGCLLYLLVVVERFPAPLFFRKIEADGLRYHPAR